LICGGKIEDGMPTPSDGVAFGCPLHGNYTVARAALPRFVMLPHDAQLAALERAKVFVAQRNGELLVTALDL
jgi:hypothetical protein